MVVVQTSYLVVCTRNVLTPGISIDISLTLSCSHTDTPFTFRSLLVRIALPYWMWGSSAMSVIQVYLALLDVALYESPGDTNIDIALPCTSLIAWMLLKLLDLQVHSRKVLAVCVRQLHGL